AAQKIVEKARKIAAHELEVAEDDLDYDRGSFSVKGAPDRAKTVGELAFSAWTAHNLPDDLEPGLDALSIYDPQNFVFPYGAHICVVEVDTETGRVDVMKYVAVDDVGTIINPQIVDGQVAGGGVRFAARREVAGQAPGRVRLRAGLLGGRGGAAAGTARRRGQDHRRGAFAAPPDEIEAGQADGAGGHRTDRRAVVRAGRR